jgi:hypothetical protein
MAHDLHPPANDHGEVFGGVAGAPDVIAALELTHLGEHRQPALVLGGEPAEDRQRPDRGQDPFRTKIRPHASSSTVVGHMTAIRSRGHERAPSPCISTTFAATASRGFLVTT